MDENRFSILLFIGAILVCSENRMARSGGARGEWSSKQRTLPLKGTKGSEFPRPTNHPLSWLGPNRRYVSSNSPLMRPGNHPCSRIRPVLQSAILRTASRFRSLLHRLRSLLTRCSNSESTPPPGDSSGALQRLRPLHPFHASDRRQEVQDSSSILTMQIFTR